MEIFKKKGDENNLWMGFNSAHGWVILDRNLLVNKNSYGGDLFFIKCKLCQFNTICDCKIFKISAF